MLNCTGTIYVILFRSGERKTTDIRKIALAYLSVTAQLGYVGGKPTPFIFLITQNPSTYVLLEPM